MTIETLVKRGNHLFSKRDRLMNLWQDIFEHFYPERADFTVRRDLGEDFAGYLSTSYPILARRDLGNSFGTMLRPTSKPWFKMTAEDFDKLGVEAKAYLEWRTTRIRKAMYNRVSQFSRATKEGDHDFATSGQCVISVEMNWKVPALLYRCWHLRDVAWSEDETGQIGEVHRKWCVPAHQAVAVFGDKCHQDIKEKAKDKPFEDVELRHIVMKSEEYMKLDGTKEHRTPWVSIWIDVKNQYEIECVGSWDKMYVIPRWQTVSGSQYAYSPATITALPDARLIQAMTRVLLDAGEVAVAPPLIGVSEALRGDIALYAGGITWVDAQYDERLGEVLRPMTVDKSGIQFGIEMQQDTRAMITEAFYLNKLTLPAPGPEMTAFEVGHRVQEYIRQALPLFEPMEYEYNGELCERTDQIMARVGAFGHPDMMPRELRGRDYSFEFESPLHDAIERAKGQRFIEGKQMLAEAAALDPAAAYIIDARTALRDVLSGIGVPTDWTRTKQAVDDKATEVQAAQNAQQQLALMQQGADVASKLAKTGVLPQ